MEADNNTKLAETVNGEYPVLLRCETDGCGVYYETDENDGNDCPECFGYDFTILTGYNTGNQDEWRSDPASYE